ncbi:hypothetical protein KAR34_07890 [bacterium]|nr:hypothetical protein [bacterium]
MPRQSRIDIPGILYHVIVRGIERRKIFRDAKDKKIFLSRMSELIEECDRYKAILCQKESYFINLVRYIHLNPLRAGIVSDAEQLDKYLWSGHSALIGKKVPLEKGEISSTQALNRRVEITIILPK